MIHYGILFLPLKDHHNIKEELEERTEERKRDPSAGEGGPNEPAQGLPVGTAVSQGKFCCKHMDLWDYWDVLLLVCHRTV